MSNVLILLFATGLIAVETFNLHKSVITETPIKEAYTFVSLADCESKLKSLEIGGECQKK